MWPWLGWFPYLDAGIVTCPGFLEIHSSMLRLEQLMHQATNVHWRDLSWGTKLYISYLWIFWKSAVISTFKYFIHVFSINNTTSKCVLENNTCNMDIGFQRHPLLLCLQQQKQMQVSRDEQLCERQLFHTMSYRIAVLGKNGECLYTGMRYIPKYIKRQRNLPFVCVYLNPQQ